MLPDWQRSGCTIQMFSRRFYYAETVGWWKTTEGWVPSHTTAWPTHCILPHFFKCLRQQGNCWKRDISSHSEHEKKKSIHHQTQLRAEADVVRAGSPSWTIFFFRIKSNKHEPTAVWTPSTLPPVPADRDDVLLAFAILLKGLWGGKGW